MTSGTHYEDVEIKSQAIVDITYKLKIGKREIDVPTELVEFDDFVLKTLMTFPNIMHTGNSKNPFVFGKGEVKMVVQKLEKYPDIQHLARRCGVKKDIANAVGQMIISYGAIHLKAVEASIEVHRNPETDKSDRYDEFQKLLEELIETDPQYRQRFEEMEEFDKQMKVLIETDPEYRRISEEIGSDED